MEENNKRKHIIKLSLVAMLVILAFTVFAAPVSAGDLHVGLGQTYTTIQSAVNAASEYDTIIVHDNGTYPDYEENVEIVVGVNNLTIKEAVGNNVTVKAANASDHVFEVTANYVNISGFTVRDGFAGIYLGNNITHCNISGNKASDNYYGIRIYSSSNNIINDNSAHSNKQWGIHLGGSSNNNNITNCSASNNLVGIFISFGATNNNIIYCNASSNNACGIAIDHTSNNNIANNRISNNNWDAGLSLFCSSNNIITKNTIDSNLNSGIRLYDSNDNIIYLNNFINNGDNVHSEGSSNIWNSISEITYTYKGNTYTNYLGNYWCDYTGSDANNDGIGDTPYSVDSDRDFYPLMEPWENYQVTESKPDLIITEKWLCWPDNCTICYNVTNIGDGTAHACHNTALYVDEEEVAQDYVPVDLALGESYIGCFDGYVWTYTPPSDNITVCADNNEALDEFDEDNNCVTNIWMCGDVNCDGKVTMSDVRKVFNRYLDPNYPLDLPWAADVNGDGKVTMSDVRKVFNRYLDPGYELNCCCEEVG